MDKKLFCFGEDYRDWFVANSLNQAIACYITYFGHDQWEMQREAYMNDGHTYSQFVESFVTEIPQDEVFTLRTEEGLRELPVRVHLESVEQVPSYFASSEY